MRRSYNTEILKELGCDNTSTKKHVKLNLPDNKTVEFDSDICNIGDSKDWFGNNYESYKILGHKVYGLMNSSDTNFLDREEIDPMFEYWHLGSKDDTINFIKSDISYSPNKAHCKITERSINTNTTEFKVEYVGIIAEDLNEGELLCGEFSVGPGPNIIFYQNGILIRTNLRTENMYKLDPSSVKVY